MSGMQADAAQRRLLAVLVKQMGLHMALIRSSEFGGGGDGGAVEPRC